MGFDGDLNSADFLAVNPIGTAAAIVDDHTPIAFRSPSAKVWLLLFIYLKNQKS